MRMSSSSFGGSWRLTKPISLVLRRQIVDMYFWRNSWSFFMRRMISVSFFPKVAVTWMNLLRENMSFTELILHRHVSTSSAEESGAVITHIGVPVQTHRDCA